MRIFRMLAAAVAAAPVWAGVIQGVVLEQASSLPLARTKVRLERVEPGGSRRVVSTATTGPVGQFFFSNIPDGFYILSATRKSFATTLFRLKPDDMRSAVLEVKPDAELFAEIRMKKLGVITGRVLDGNHVGIPDVKVLAYPAKLPLQMAAQATSDDRGVFRIFGLLPGRYYIRTAAQQLEDGAGVLPTFHPHGTEAKDAAVVVAVTDRETTDIDLRPSEGNLFKLAVTATGCKEPEPIAFVLASDTGRKQGTATCRTARADYEFTQLAPGEYEVLVYSQNSATAGHQSAFYVSRDGTAGVLLRTLPDLIFRFKPERAGMTITARRRDLAGTADPITLQSGTAVLPGLWEFTAAPPAPAYVVSIGDMWRGPASRRVGVSSDWFPVYVQSDQYVAVDTSDAGASISGVAKLRGEPVASAPVHLFPFDIETMRRMGGPRLGFSDAQGRYYFSGVAPGRYLLAGAFDVFEVTEDALLDRKAEDIAVLEGQNISRDLTLPDQ